MKQLNSKNPLDESNGTVKNKQNSKMQTSGQSPKTPWFMCLPEAILRKSGLIVVLALTVTGILLMTSSTERVEA